MTGFAVVAVVAVIGAAAGLLARSRHEKKYFVTDQYKIYSDKLGSGERNFVFLSDLHNNVFGKDNEELIGEIDRIRPDAVLIGGDMMICRDRIDLSVISGLVENLAGRYPVYYANGNHEQRMGADREYRELFEDFINMLKRSGVHYLSDTCVLFGEDISIAGCNLEERYYRHRFTVPELSGQVIEKHVGQADRSRFQILLLHSPLFFEGCREWGADLTLSGHFHGGTIRLPFLGGVMTPQYQFFLPWCAGRFDRDNKTMLVSRGLGTHSINIRLNNRAQLIWIRLMKDKEN